MNGTAAELTTWYQRTFHGQADQVARIRREIAAHLDGCPAAADAVLIASELAANAVTHSDSQGEFITVRCQAYPDYVWIEVEDLGGAWHRHPPLAQLRPDHHQPALTPAPRGPGRPGTGTGPATSGRTSAAPVPAGGCATLAPLAPSVTHLWSSP
jgi:anti-sigma regulatory factor (Ser/Thr protein kinase)